MKEITSMGHVYVFRPFLLGGVMDKEVDFVLANTAFAVGHFT